MSKQSVLSAINKILKRIEKQVDVSDLRNITANKVSEVYRKALRDLDKIYPQLIDLFDAYDLEGQYRIFYNRTARELQRQGLAIENLPSKIDTQVKRVRDAFEENMKQMLEMARFNLLERERMTKEFVNNYNTGLERRNRIYKQYGMAQLPETELQKLASDIANRFDPVSGIKRFRNEYYNLDNNRAKVAYNRKWNETSEAMTNILNRSFRSGWSYSETMKSMVNILQRQFPSGSFPVPIRRKGTDRVTYRNFEIRYYAEMKMKYYNLSMDSFGTVNANLDAGNDTVEYILTGKNHSQICLDMASGSDYYSLSGQSKKYPLLEVYPPAHYNCKSKIIAAPTNKRESIDRMGNTRKDTRNNIFDSPQQKENIFEKEQKF